MVPVVVIQCLVYNHEPYLRQCLDGFVMQQTDFPFVAIVHDDASTDHSADIIREYTTKYPNIFIPIYETENQYSLHNGSISRKMSEALIKTGAHYIAFCEGDDFWTDPFKLQKQVDFLERHREYLFCCHRFSIYEQKYGIYRKEYGYYRYKQGENLEITEDLFLKVWVTQMLTTMFRADIFTRTLQQVCDLYSISRDTYVFYELLQQGKGISLNQNMGIYRWHDGGIAIGQSLLNRYTTAVQVYTKIYKQHSIDKLLLPKIRYNYNHLLRYTNPFRDGHTHLKEALSYCDSFAQKLQMIGMYLILPHLFIIPNKLFRYYWQKKCLLSNPS